MNQDNVTDINPEMSRAISLYGQDDSSDDFPVLKAFQQYIDAEQAKARKRMLAMGIFFGLLMFVVIAVFVVLLMTVSERNQTLNDRLIEFAMRDRESRGSAVVVQSPQDNSAMMTLNAKLDEMQKQLAESQAKAERLAAEAAAKAKQAAIEAAKPKELTPEEQEIKRLKALLAEEKKKAETDARERRQQELERYRRQHYPELYEQPVQRPVRRVRKSADEEIDDLVDDLSFLDDDKAIKYFDSEEDDREVSTKRQRTPPSRKSTKSKVERVEPEADENDAEKDYSIPVDVKGSSSNWRIPND